MLWQGQLLGFVFFNAGRIDAFSPGCLSELDVVAQFLTLRELAESKLDPFCVEALIDQRAEVEEIQRVFRENPFG